MPVYDVSAPLRPDLPSWPGDESFRRKVVRDLSTGDDATVSQLSLSAHNGTHMDSPCHFLPGAAGIEALRLDVLVGPATVVGLEHLRGPITAADLDVAGVAGGTQRLLAKTSNSGWSTRETSFREDFIAFDVSGARWCVDNGVRLVGIDYLSIEPFGAGRTGHPVHKILLEAGVVIVEGLDLAAISPGPYTLAALPLLIPGGDGAPARVVIID
jgi:arylformamidase